ncbi:hypothetical protein FACS1894187_19810 [Synergistales bacterium]|nr:hypothetical protein FACS1894187_19810 [Synergistales bacterium]
MADTKTGEHVISKRVIERTNTRVIQSGGHENFLPRTEKTEKVIRDAFHQAARAMEASGI